MSRNKCLMKIMVTIWILQEAARHVLLRDGKDLTMGILTSKQFTGNTGTHMGKENHGDTNS